jgi:4-aminobutyrate aminotransferase/(S)-3-amino-2-methylpropionate transaminase
LAQRHTASVVGTDISGGPFRAVSTSTHRRRRWPPSIRVKTPIPGPRSLALSSEAVSVARPVRPTSTVFIERGRGALVEDVDGNILVDMTAGLGCLLVGHSDPRVVQAVRQQAGRFTHTDFSVLAYESYVRLAERIGRRCGGAREVAFFNSGAEAVENAVKVARYATGRPGIVCFDGAFHGRTNLALSLTAREEPYKHGFGPFSPDVYRLPYPGLDGSSLAGFEAAAAPVFGTKAIAAAIVEPMLGEGGFVVPPPAFLGRLQELCRGHGALLITDEIQTGYGRTGRFLAGSHFGIDPDLIVLGKAIAAGLPLSAVVGRPEIMELLPPGTLGGTYVGNPVACAAGLAVLETIEESNLIERAVGVGERLQTFWRAAAADSQAIVAVRGLGSMVGVGFASRKVLSELMSFALSNGVLAVSCGARGDVLRHLVPLVITDQQLEDTLDVFRNGLGKLAP